METFQNVVVLVLAIIVFPSDAQDHAFPDNFLFGAATASYQVEGAWNVTGKGENIWDRLTHQRPELIRDRSNGDIACDSYSKTQEDVQLLSDLGVDFYRFSISWSRLLPSGYTNYINGDGLRYYNELIDELLAYNITPYVTMYHWDLPQPLQEVGGWPNAVMADYFLEFADTLYRLFGDRVKHWITFNEPMIVCNQGYSLALKAPAFTSDGIACYLCGHTLLLAHARAYRLYERNFKDSQGGRVGITIDTSWYGPRSDAESDVLASERKMQMSYGWYVNPIFSKEGDYPAVMRKRIDAQSRAEGFPASRLPRFSEAERNLVRGSADFLGLNHYTTNLCYATKPIIGNSPSHRTDIAAECYLDDSWEESASDWLRVVPWGLRRLLNWIKDTYGNPEVVITENGFSDVGGISDCRRINYYNSYLEQLLLAMHEDGCNVTGYTAWSFLDNFEWFKGYTERFGLHFVDFKDPGRPRTVKQSAHVYRNIIETRRIDRNYTPSDFPECEW